ncbi:hypothetical protein [Flaviflexus equikiangi]|uniref:hypothetical protein n=1 Tax=Flaviflexus equikiangi TaxID=2758573 RepID=UPI0015F47E69|nr:hypothetical protein [Flaviflexus equikiangi]
MLFRRRRAELPPVTDPAIDAHIHWLGMRGLVARDGLTREEWIAAAGDPSDPMSLADALTSGRPCAVPIGVTVTGTDLVRDIELLADGLGLPIDDVTLTDSTLLIRSGTTRSALDASGPNVLSQVASMFVDAVHVLLVEGRTFAVVHGDVAEQAERALRQGEYTSPHAP